MKLRFIFATLFLSMSINAQSIIHVDNSLRLPLQRALLELKKVGVDYDPMSEPFILMYGKTRNQAAAASLGRHKDGVLILVNQSVFDSYDIRAQVWIIIHELAHDVFDLGHTEDGVMIAEIPNAITMDMWRQSMNILKEQINNRRE